MIFFFNLWMQKLSITSSSSWACSPVKGQIKCQKTKILTPSTWLVSVPAAEFHVSMSPRIFLNEGKLFRRSCCYFGSFFSVERRFFLWSDSVCWMQLVLTWTPLSWMCSGQALGMGEFHLWEWWRISDLRTSRVDRIKSLKCLSLSQKDYSGRVLFSRSCC